MFAVPNQPQAITKASFKLRRAIQPKNAILLLNELVGPKQKLAYEYLDVPLGENDNK